MKKIPAFLVISSITLGGVWIANAAQASEGSGSCVRSDGANGGDECVYYHANETGACFADPIKDAYTNWVFATCTSNPNFDSDPSSGTGQPVRNDAASVQNWSLTNTAHIWQFPNWTGDEQDDLPNSAVNLQSDLANNEASQSWG